MTLGNIASTNEKYRDLILESGAVQGIIEILNRKKIQLSLHKACLFLISDLFQQDPPPPLFSIFPLIPYISEGLWLSDEDSIKDALFAFFAIISNPEALKTPGIITNPLIGRMVQLSKSADKKIQFFALKNIGNISAGDDKYGFSLVEEGIIGVLEKVIEEKKSFLFQIACWTLSNLAACGEKVVEVFLQEKIHKQMLLFFRDTNLSNVREAVWVLSNTLEKGNEEHFRLLIKDGVFDACTSLLKHRDVRLLNLLLDNLNKTLTKARDRYKDNILYTSLIEKFQFNGGLTQIELLQTYPNSAIYESCLKLMKEHFETEESASLGEKINNFNF